MVHIDDLELEQQRQAYELFQGMADHQRYKGPESAMSAFQKHYSGLWGWFLEHLGDLTHRMGDRALQFDYGYEWVKEKVDKAHNRLKPKSGWLSVAEDVMQQTDSNGKFHEERGNMTASEYEDKAYSLALDYAKEHYRVPVYNKVHELGRRAATAAGNSNWDLAYTAISDLKKITDQGRDHYVSQVGLIDPKHLN